jgi:hypothetical protein
MMTLCFEASIDETGDFQTELKQIQQLLQEEVRRLGGEKPDSLPEQKPSE